MAGVCDLRVGGFDSLSSDQVGQVRDLVQTPYAIPKIPPEGHTQLPAGCLQAEKSIPATPARVAPRPSADFSLLHVLPDVVL
jgi:hypothetical protein